MSPESPNIPSNPTSISDRRGDASVVFQFFVLPSLVVAGLLGVFLLFSWSTRGSPSAQDYLETLQSGRFNQRWQAAFELSNLLRQNRGSQDNTPVVMEMIRVYRQLPSGPEVDPRIRRYLTLALGESGSPEAIAPLLDASGDRDDVIRLYAMGGLARLHASEAIPIFLKGLRDPEPSIRSVSAYALGGFAGRDDLVAMEDLINDPVEEVRWNAALALGRQGRPTGEAVLIELLERRHLDRYPGMDPDEKSRLILDSIRALNHLGTKGLEEKLRDLARNDPDSTVRRAAAACLETAHP